MPRFYFNLLSADGTLVDSEGLELSDERAVEREALRALREMLAEDIRRGTVDMALRLEVLNAAREPIHDISCAVVLNNGIPIATPRHDP